MASIRKRKGKRGITYQAEIRVSGRRPIRKTFKRKTDAAQWISLTEPDIRKGSYFRREESEKRTVAEMVDAYTAEGLPHSNRRVQLRWWRDNYGHRVLADFTSVDIEEGKRAIQRLETRRGALVAPATVNRYLAALSHCFSRAVRWGWVVEHPIKGGKVEKVKEPAGRDRFLSDDERGRLLEACKASEYPLLYPLVILALSTGGRAGELTGLRWRDIDFERGMAVLHRTKNGEKRALPIKGLALSLLRDLRKVKRIDTDLVFPNGPGTNPWLYARAWGQALQEAEIDDFRFHDLRHSCASYLAMNGASMAEIGAVLGHKTLQMVKRYTHLSDAHISGVVERMNAQVLGQ